MKKTESIYDALFREWKKEKDLRPNQDKYSYFKKSITNLLKMTDYRQKIEEMDLTQFKYLHDTKIDKYYQYSEFAQTQDSQSYIPVLERTDKIEGMDVVYVIPDEKTVAELYVTCLSGEDKGIDVVELDELTDLLKAVETVSQKMSEGGRPKGLTKRTISRYKKVNHRFEILKKKYSSKTKAELYELLATRDYDGKSYKRKTIRNIIEDKKYNLIPSQ